MNFYKTRRWLRKRASVLRRDEYLCQEAKRYGKSIPATMVHHIYPLEQYPELALVDWNLVSLSDKWHNAMHDRDSHELTELGRQWQERVRDQFETWYAFVRRVESEIVNGTGRPQQPVGLIATIQGGSH